MIKTVNLSPQDITLSELEVAARLKTKLGYTDNAVEECKAELFKVITPKFCYSQTEVSIINEDTCRFDFGELVSRNLAENLKNCKKAYLLAATVGVSTDRFIARCLSLSPAKGFIADALSSAAVEAVCDYADSFLRGENKKPMRFSAGYGDLDLKNQPIILERLSAYKNVGITLTKGFLMVPQKSVTAILGVQDD